MRQFNKRKIWTSDFSPNVPEVIDSSACQGRHGKPGLVRVSHAQARRVTLALFRGNYNEIFFSRGSWLFFVICIITIVGLPVGILLTIGYIFILLFATVIVALLAAHWINNTYYQGEWRSRKIAFAAFGIFIFLKLASLTPFVGPLVMLVLACMGFGGILQNVKLAHSKAAS